MISFPITLDQLGSLSQAAGSVVRLQWSTIHLVSVLPNAGAHHEFKGQDTQVRFECKTSPLKVVHGKIRVPTGPGLGVEIDPEFIQKHRPVTA
jgi:L-alanine-DL-glutamate epimerase-like enolase superfamily enzyme